MNPVRWQQIKAGLHRALELKAATPQAADQTLYTQYGQFIAL